jgi:hypothetical protein
VWLCIDALTTPCSTERILELHSTSPCSRMWPVHATMQRTPAYLARPTYMQGTHLGMPCHPPLCRLSCALQQCTATATPQQPRPPTHPPANALPFVKS